MKYRDINDKELVEVNSKDLEALVTSEKLGTYFAIFANLTYFKLNVGF